MKSILALSLIGFSVFLCKLPDFNRNSNSNNSNNTNNANNTNSTESIKDKFVGTWDHPTEGRYHHVVLQFKSDDTFKIESTDSDSDRTKTTTGTWKIRGEKAYLDGDPGREVKDGFSLDGDRLVVSVNDGKQKLYFNKK